MILPLTEGYNSDLLFGTWLTTKHWRTEGRPACLQKSGTVPAAADDRMPHNVRGETYASVRVRRSPRDFSSVGRTVADMRSRLNEETVEAVELLRWGMRAGLIVK